MLLCVTALQAEEEWPRFRGPQGNGHTEAKHLPTTWSEEENVTWKTPIVGRGHSSPVISGNMIWMTTAIEKPISEEEKRQRLENIPNSRTLNLAGNLSLRAICVHRESGKILHDLEIFHVENPQPIHQLNSYASPTPIIEADRLYCHFGTYGTACLDISGQRPEFVWKTNRFKIDHQNGPGASPIIWKDLVICNFDGIDVQYVAAMNKHSGDLVWKTPRSGKLAERVDFKKAYCTPVVIEEDGRAQLISPGADWVYSYDPGTGRELWRANYGKLGFSTVPKPVVGHGLVYICTSYMRSRLLAIDYTGSGDVSDSHVRWLTDRQVPKKPSLLLDGDELYFISDGGILTCVDAVSGEEIYRERLPGDYSASPLWADGKIYFCNQSGLCTVIQAGREFRQEAENRLAEGFMASPAVADGALFLRTDHHLYRIEK